MGWLRQVTKDKYWGNSLAAAVRNLRMVDPDSVPTQEDIDRLSKYFNANVSQGVPQDWYALFRGTQGNPAEMLAAGVIEDEHDFPLDSLFAEWGYVIDLDKSRLEVYRGFQHHPHTQGRFALRETDRSDYYPCAQIASWSLTHLPSDETMERLENDEVD